VWYFPSGRNGAKEAVRQKSRRVVGAAGRWQGRRGSSEAGQKALCSGMDEG
jgi:hypothetical protein